MYVITFYSFKGGVGRTMALVNVAAELIRRGRKVLVVDFDLEAPGLETYKQLRPKQPHPGIVEYVTEFRRTQEVPDLREYIYEAKPIGKRDGRLWVMPAGRRDRDYRNALTDLDWKRLYQDEGGFLLFEDTKKGWEKELKPDYVLIDSRTGDTDVLGICTRQLPDAVVLMFIPNEQNLAGLVNVVRDIRREETDGLKKKIQLHFVASNVPRLDDEEGILQRRLRHFYEALEVSRQAGVTNRAPTATPWVDHIGIPRLDGVIDRYDSLLHLDQQVFVLERPRSRLARQYRRLVRRLIVRNVEDREGAMVQLSRYRHDSDLVTQALDSESEISALYTLRRITDAHPEDQQVLVLAAELHIRMCNYEEAYALLDQALRLQDNPNARLLRSRCHYQFGRKELAVEDLLAVIRLAATPESLLVQAIQDLHRYDARRLHEDVVRQRFDGLPPFAKRQVANLFEKTHEDFDNTYPMNIPMGVGYDMLLETETDEQSMLQTLELHRLSREFLYQRRWTDVIELPWGRTKQFIRRYQALALIHQGLAHWGLGGKMPEQLCHEIVKITHSPSACDKHAADCQALALVYWRLGERTRAKEYVQKALQLMDKHEMPETSYWRCLETSPEEFSDDCRQINRLIEGEPLQPLFLIGRSRPELGEPDEAHAPPKRR